MAAPPPSPLDRVEAEEYFYAVDDRFQLEEDEKCEDAFRRLTASQRWNNSATDRQRNNFHRAIQRDIDALRRLPGFSTAVFNQYMLGLIVTNVRSRLYLRFLRSTFAHRAEEAARALEAGGVQHLQAVILRYALRTPDNLPMTRAQCRNVLDAELFVNIYDYAEEGNTTRFLNVRALARYTKRTNQIYPLRLAKENFAFKILLRRIGFYLRNHSDSESEREADAEN